MTPANAPIGVKNAPRLLPMIVAKRAGDFKFSERGSTTDENKTLIGMLLMMLQQRNDEMP